MSQQHEQTLPSRHSKRGYTLRVAAQRERAEVLERSASFCLSHGSSPLSAEECAKIGQDNPDLGLIKPSQARSLRRLLAAKKRAQADQAAGRPTLKRRIRQSRLLTDEEETHIVQIVKDLDGVLSSVGRSFVASLAVDLLRARRAARAVSGSASPPLTKSATQLLKKIDGIDPLVPVERLFSRNFFRGFEERHSAELKLKKIKLAEPHRQLMQRTDICKWHFEQLEACLRKYGIMDVNGVIDMSRIVNLDEVRPNAPLVCFLATQTNMFLGSLPS